MEIDRQKTPICIEMHYRVFTKNIRVARRGRAGPGGAGEEEARDGQPALHLATQWGQTSVVTALIEHGADLAVADSEGRTALHHAIEAGQTGIINLLLGCPGVDLVARDRQGLSPFAAAMTYKAVHTRQFIVCMD